MTGVIFQKQNQMKSKNENVECMRIQEGMIFMKKSKKKALSVSFLVVVMLVIMAFTRNWVQDCLMIAAVSLWLVFSFGIVLMRKAVRLSRLIKKTVQTLMVQLKQKILEDVPEQKPKKIYNIDLAEEPENLTMFYVNRLITVHLQSAFPNAVWDWVSREPFLLIKSCGTGKIKTKGTGEYNYAEVSFDKIGGISVNLFKYAPRARKNVSNNSHAEYDLGAWYSVKGQKALMDIIKDLSAKGYGNMMLRKGGEIFTGTEEQQVKSEGMLLDDFPDKVYWKKLVTLINDGHIKANAGKDEILVKWC